MIIVVILTLMSLPKESTQKARGFVASILKKPWEMIVQGKQWFRVWPFSSSNMNFVKNVSSVPEEMQRLLLENKQLYAELKRLRDLREHESFIEKKLSDLKQLSSSTEKLKKSFYRHYNELYQILKLEIQAIPARVIFRDPAFWENSLWVNVGEVDNESFNRKVVAINSPVVVGASVVGVVDFVGQKQSRVRLLSDPGLNPSVRVTRGGKQNMLLHEHVEALMEALIIRDDLFFSKEYNASLLNHLNVLKSHLQQFQETTYLAKGILRGSVSPSMRVAGSVLRGVGFNYDFPDDRGGARDLRSGEFVGGKIDLSASPIVKENDLLETTGMDGVFPEGLRVATVTKIDPLKEGGYAYDLEAKSTAGDLDSLTMVFIIPPIGYSRKEQPTFFH